MAQNVTIAGASYPDVPSIVVPKTGGGSAAFLDTSDADATAADVRSGKKFYGSSGSDTGSMPDGSAATPATAITANPTITVSSSGLITASVSKSQNVTPTVSPGYVANGTAGTIAVSGSNTNQLATQAGQTITPGTSDIVIPAQKFLTGAQTIKGDANLVAANIAKDVTIFGVTGTLSGGFSNSDALIHVNAPYGSTVTFAKGGVTVKVLSPSDAFANVDGETADYYYPVTSANFGSWTVTATISGTIGTKNVQVDSAKQYNLKVGGKYAWTQYSKFTSDGLGSSEWVSTDGQHTINKIAGTWTVSNGKLVADGNTYFRTSVPKSNILIGIRCAVDSGFSPVSSGEWFRQSRIFGCELPGTQKDYGLTIINYDHAIRATIGYANSSYSPGNRALPMGTYNDLFLLYTGSVFTLYQNGEVVNTVNYTASGTESSQLGIYWNNESASTKVKGTIAAFGIWEFEDIGGSDVILPSLD